MGVADFSMEKALGSGFRVIARNPAAIGVWAVFYLVVGLGPSMLLMPGLGHPMSADPQAAFTAISKMMVWMPFLWVLSLAHAAIAYGAVYRAVLTPEDGRYFYLRLSRQELWLGLTLLVMLVLFVAFTGVAAIIIGVLSRSVPGVVTFLAIVGALAVVVWLALRLSMAGLMAFTERRFVLMESWTLTQGLGWKLFGVAFCQVVIILALELVVLLPTMLVLGLTGAFKGLAEAAKAGHPLAYPLPVIAAYLIVLPIFGALMYAILGGPWASIYQQIDGPRAEAA